MARMDSLYCPFTPKIHADASSVHEGSVLWARSMGMLPTEQHVRSANHTKVGWLVARGFPTAAPRALQLMADWTMLLCLLDDYVEGLDTADEVSEYLQHLLHLLRGNVTGLAEDPVAEGVMDLRQRMLTQVSPSHFDRFTDRMEELFASNVAEARNRENAQIPSIASYFPLRELTIGLQVMISLAEPVEGFSLPDCTREHPALQQLATRASYIVGWANDLFTYEKEIIQGEIHNLVLVLMNEYQLTIAEAVAEAISFHNDEVRSFLEEVDQLPSFGVADAGVARYVEVLQCWIRGHLDWAHETGRYRPVVESTVERISQPAGASVAA